MSRRHQAALDRRPAVGHEAAPGDRGRCARRRAGPLGSPSSATAPTRDRTDATAGRLRPAEPSSDGARGRRAEDQRPAATAARDVRSRGRAARSDRRPTRAAAHASQGTAESAGDLKGGSGTFTAGDSISGGYTFKSRFEDGPGSNPRAAHRRRARRVLLDGAVEHPRRGRQPAGVGADRGDGQPAQHRWQADDRQDRPASPRVVCPGIDEATFVEHAERPRPDARSAGRSHRSPRSR